MDFDISIFADGHRVGHAFELGDPSSPSQHPMGEVRRQEGGAEDEREGTAETKSRGDANPAVSDLRVPEGHVSNFKNKLQGLCNLCSRAATGISSDRLLQLDSMSGRFIHICNTHFVLIHF